MLLDLIWPSYLLFLSSLGCKFIHVECNRCRWCTVTRTTYTLAKVQKERQETSGLRSRVSQRVKPIFAPLHEHLPRKLDYPRVHINDATTSLCLGKQGVGCGIVRDSISTLSMDPGSMPETFWTLPSAGAGFLDQSRSCMAVEQEFLKGSLQSGSGNFEMLRVP